MVSSPFILPRGITGHGIDVTTELLAERRDAFVAWAQTVASAVASPAVEFTDLFPTPSFDVVHLERSEIWLLHNRFVPLVGALGVRPEPGPSWAVAGRFVDVPVPPHAKDWGPPLAPTDELNRDLAVTDLEHFLPTARAQADRYSPITVGNVVFNYWT